MFWTEAAEYATYILNRSPTRSNPGGAPPIQMLTGKPTTVSDIVVFGSPCMVWRDPRKKSLAKHAERGLILGRNDETKGFKVLLLKDRVVTTTRHVTQIEILSEDANQKVARLLQGEINENPDENESRQESVEDPGSQAAQASREDRVFRDGNKRNPGSKPRKEGQAERGERPPRPQH